jgi:aminoglycoside 3-N-acetyltransferase
MLLQKLKRKALSDALEASGVRAGSNVYVQSSLWGIGPVEIASEQEIPAFYLDTIREALGEGGTLITLTSSKGFSRAGEPFSREDTPSDAGVLSEFIRTQPGAVRTIHPIISVAAIGAGAARYGEIPHYDGFGYDSPWRQMLDDDALIIALGQGLGYGPRGNDSTTYVHFIEQSFGVPYQYTKIFEGEVRSRGELLQGPFTLSVRYLDCDIIYNSLPFRRAMVENGEAVLVPVGRGQIFATTARKMFDAGVRALRHDRYALLDRPPAFRRGEKPLDGLPPGDSMLRDERGRLM